METPGNNDSGERAAFNLITEGKSARDEEIDINVDPVHDYVEPEVIALSAVTAAEKAVIAAENNVTAARAAAAHSVPIKIGDFM